MNYETYAWVVEELDGREGIVAAIIPNAPVICGTCSRPLPANDEEAWRIHFTTWHRENGYFVIHSARSEP